MKLYEVTLEVRYTQRITVYANDEDDAFDWAERQAQDSVPDSVYAHIDCIDVQIDADSYDDKDR